MKHSIPRAAALTLAAALLLILCACTAAQSESHTDAPYCTFTDALGTTVTLAHKPQRVAVLFSSFADLWRTAGGEIAITVGESVERGFADASVILVDDGAGKAINTELLLAAQPDFVLCSADIEAQVNAAQMLRRAGISAACMRVETFDDYLAALRTCTDITGDKEAYRVYGEAVKARIDELLASLDSVQSEKRILFIRAGSGAGATKAKTANEHFAAAMLRELGTYNIAENAPILLDGLSIEEILREDPDYIFISPMGNEAAARAHMDAVLAQSAWQSLTAVKNGCYVYLPKDLFQFKPNARWAEAYEYLIETLYEKEN